MYRMLISTHYKYTEELFRAFLDGYRETLVDAQESIDRMDTISKRGRYIVRE
jgi:tRNA A-37 threonylcarbamoyl transferase component Bud32